MVKYYEMWGEQCSICFHHTDDYYLINECLCKQLICLTCIAEHNKCPYCHKLFTSDTLMFTDEYRQCDDVLLIQTVQHWTFDISLPYTMYTELKMFKIICT